MENNQTTPQLTEGLSELHFDLGTFEGFSFRHDQAIDRNLTAAEVVGWDHDAAGEAEFWPSMICSTNWGTIRPSTFCASITP